MYLWLYHNAPKKIYCIFAGSQSIIALCKFILLLDFCGFSIDYISENLSGLIAVFETNFYVRLCIIPLSEASVTVPNELSEKKLCWRVYGNDLFHLRIRFIIACGIWTRESLYESMDPRTLVKISRILDSSVPDPWHIGVEVTSFFKDRKSRRVTKWKESWFFFLLKIEGSGAGSIPQTSGSGSGRPKNMWIR